jgi:hypothetical protein
VSEDGKNVVKLIYSTNVFSPEIVETIRLDFKSEKRDEYYLETWERCLDRDEETLKKQENDRKNYFNNGCFCKEKVIYYVGGSFCQSPTVQSFTISLRSNVEKFTKQFKKENCVSQFLRIATVKNHQITKLFETTDRFTEENLRDQTIVFYDVTWTQNAKHYLTVQMFDIGTQNFFGFPFLFEKPFNTSLNQITKNINEKFEHHLANKTERTIGCQIEDWWNCERSPERTQTDAKKVIFDVHKVILMARSEVFEAMLASPESKESLSNQLVISDLKPEIVEEVIQFIYSDKCVDIDSNAVGLYVASDKYFLRALKTQSTNIIRQKRLPKLRQSLYLAAFGDLYNEKSITENAIRQIVPNLSAIIKTDYWIEFSQIHPSVAIDILSRVVPN